MLPSSSRSWRNVDCVNIVYRGSIVGSPAWAPRTTGALVLPKTPEELADARVAWLLSDGKQGSTTYAVDGARVQENEPLQDVASGRTGGSDSGSSGGESGGGASSDQDKVEAASLAPPLVDLWDNGWPEHRYYYTAVPVAVLDLNLDTPRTR